MALLDTVKKYDSVALLLQGGGALGSYQAGIYEGLHNAGIKIDRIMGISIGAINSALIAGNPHSKRLDALRGFWDKITRNNYSPKGVNPFRYTRKTLETLDHIDLYGHAMPYIFENDFLKQQLRVAESSFEAFRTMLEGQRGFFKPRGFIPFDATPNHLSYYTTDKLKDTLAEFVDLKLLNNPKNMKVSVGAVNVRTGNYTVFSNENMELTFDHIIASGALPPGFPAVEIDGDYYWDGGLVSNTPLDDLIENPQSINQLIFQVDLWDARGQVPENLIGIDERIKDIQYSSKTRYATTVMKKRHTFNHLVKELLQYIPKDQRTAACFKEAEALTSVGFTNVFQLIYRKKAFERGHKDYEFSAHTMYEHWNTGLDDIKATLRQEPWFEMSETGEIFEQHDIHKVRRYSYDNDL